MTRLALFDLDNTLLGGDSDHSWGEFMVANQLVDGDYFKQQNDQFYQDYQNGCLDMYAYAAFALEPLSRYSTEELNKLHYRFMHEHIIPMVLPKGQELLQQHREDGDTIIIITATHDFITYPIAKYMGVDILISTTAEQINDQYTGNIIGTPCIQEGKISKLKDWLDTTDLSLTGARFYSDSFNDIPLLQEVDEPVAVDPDDKLRAHAQACGWPIISLR